MDNPLQQVQDSPPSPRAIYVIAREIQQNWVPVNHRAVPYLNAMRQLRRMEDMAGLEYGDMVVAHFLAASQGWRGTIARRIKAELILMLGEYNKRNHS